MSVYTISNNYLDKYDPYWLSRNLALKVGAVSIMLCLVNMFLKSPSSPTSYMMTALIATLASELLPSNTLKKKILIYVAIASILTLSQILFGLFSYFRFGLFSFVVLFSYLVLRFMAYNPKAAVLPTLMILWGFIALEGGESTDLNAVLNSLLYSAEYCLAAIFCIFFFPSFKDLIFNNAFMKILKTDISFVYDKTFKNSNPEILSSINILKSTLNNLPDSYKNLYKSIIKFQYEYLSNTDLTIIEKNLAISILSDLIFAISNDAKCSLDSYNLIELKNSNNKAYNIITELIESYNLCKV